MSLALMSLAWESDLPSSDKMVLLCLCNFANDTGDCWPSISTLSKKTGLSERTVQRAIRRMIDAGILTIKERSGTSTNYRIHPRHIDTPVTVTPHPRRGDTPVMVTPRHSDTPPPSPCHPTPVTVTPHPRHGDTQTIIEPSLNHQGTNKRATAHGRPDGVDEPLWQDFVTHRKSKRAAITATAMAAIQKEADSAGWTLSEVMTEMMARGWQGFKADWVADKKPDRINGKPIGNGFGGTVDAQGLTYGI